MEANNLESPMEAAEKEFQNIIKLRFMTAFEKGMESLKREIQAAEDEFRLARALQSGAFVKKLLELRCKAAGDIVSTTLDDTKRDRIKHGLRWNEQSLSAIIELFDEFIEDLFSRQKASLDRELSQKYGPGGPSPTWALQAIDEEKLKLSAEIRREVEILRSQEKIKAATKAQETDVALLGELRKRLTDDQRKVLNTIWEYYRQNKDWIPIRILHRQMEKGFVLSAIGPLGGSIVFKNQVGAKECYELTPLGVLLSGYGSEAEKLLAGYLDYIRNQYLKNPMVEKVTAEEVQQSLQLIDEQVELLGRLILLGYFYGGSASSGRKWECGVPKDIDDLPGISDLHEYVQERAVRGYDPKIPIEPNDRSRYLLSKETKEQETKFDFIQDPLLRDQLVSDWDEVKRIRDAKAWKSCVILCGGILEGMLLDVLRRDEEQAKSVYQKVLKGKATPDFNYWELADMVDVAKSLGLLSKSSEHLGHGLREFRNLIHPGKQVRERITLTQEEAEIAFNIIKVCLREFSSRFQPA
jgi:hypothetical protein